MSLDAFSKFLKKTNDNYFDFHIQLGFKFLIWLSDQSSCIYTLMLFRVMVQCSLTVAQDPTFILTNIFALFI